MEGGALRSDAMIVFTSAIHVTLTLHRNNPLIRHSELSALLLLLVVLALLQISCGGGGSDSSPLAPPSTLKTVKVSWNANRETAVNATGGGYKVYYSNSSGFDISDAGVGVVDVPFVAPPAAPTSISLQLSSGQYYYFRVVAYSTLTPPWGSYGSTSSPSAQISLLVP